MKISPATPLGARARPQPSRSEFAVRYAASYACTLIAVAAAQLIIPNPFAGLLALITLIGLPLSLLLRRSKLRVFGWHIPRFTINSFIVISTGMACLYLLLWTQPDFFTRGAYNSMMITTRSAGESIGILMNMFLIFAAIRSLAIINDKDAVLSAVPSFSVLLLLIVVHRGPQVVAYFLLWAVVAAILFSLDHREESRSHLSGVVPSLVPGQDIKLSARGLATVMSFSLACAISISYFLTSRNPEERGLVENWILGMASRMTQLALNMPDDSINAGPERQIDFSSGPAVPTRAELWTVAAVTYDWKLLRPQYWRMFTLSQYDGTMWSQSPGSGTTVPLRRLTESRWPPLQQPQGNNSSSENNSSPGSRNSVARRVRPLPLPRNRAPQARLSPSPSLSSQPAPSQYLRNQYPPKLNSARDARRPRLLGQERQLGRTLSQSASQPQATPTATPQAIPKAPPNSRPRPMMRQTLRRRRIGYDIAGRHPFLARTIHSFGGPRRLVIQLIEPRISNVGYLPVLPGARALRIRAEEPAPLIRARQDGAVDVGVLQSGQSAVVLSEVAPDEAYGLGASRVGGPPQTKNQIPNTGAILTPQERHINLQLPSRLKSPDSRLHRYAAQILSSAKTNESNYARARRLAWAIQQGAVYTLRPPQIPTGADAAEYFLFTSRRGYCTYFAGALTVLCRSAGIPSRVVSGFVNPEWSQGQSGILREANGHAWTEVWVDGWGWAVVDATPPGDRGDNAPSWWESWSDLMSTALDNLRHWSQRHARLLMWSALALVPVLLLLATRSGLGDPFAMRLNTSTRGRVKLSRDQSRRLVFKAYGHATKRLARKFRPRTPWETPHEYLTSAETVLDLENPAPLRQLTGLYAQAKYSPATLDSSDGTAAYKALKNLSWKMRKS